MELRPANDIDDYARRVEAGLFGSVGLSAFRVDSVVERNALLDAVARQRFAHCDAQTAVSYGIEQNGRDFNVTLPMNAPPHERGRIEHVANQRVSKMKTIQRLKLKHAQKHKTDNTS